MISALRWRPAARAGLTGAGVIVIEWARVLLMRTPELALPALALGGAALALLAWGWPAERIGVGTSRLGVRVLGGFALAAVLLLPAAVRPGAAPILPAGLALAAVAVSIGEEVAFRGALYAALEDVGGAPLAVLGSTLLWTLAHALSHPPAFLGAVAAAGLLLALWRWAFKDLVAPVIAHVIADVTL